MGYFERTFEAIWTNPERKAIWFRRLWWLSLVYLSFGYVAMILILAGAKIGF
ncbi:MAG TPA: hypothetical protein VM681_09655 [Candidatus Thermoplasmatota archaeon]|nr:hypothetical protein [Candidatus Thermoplasmatota archaeon]